MIQIEGGTITISDDVTASNYSAGHADFSLIPRTGETVHIPFVAIRFALSVLASCHECESFDDLLRVLGGRGEWEWPGPRKEYRNDAPGAANSAP